jgi:hypothetical protein
MLTFFFFRFFFFCRCLVDPLKVYYHWSDLAVFNFRTQEWMPLIIKGTPPSARWGNQATIIRDNLYSFGGGTDFTCLNDVYVFKIDLSISAGIVLYMEKTCIPLMLDIKDIFQLKPEKVLKV